MIELYCTSLRLIADTVSEKLLWLERMSLNWSDTVSERLRKKLCDTWAFHNSSLVFIELSE